MAEEPSPSNSLSTKIQTLWQENRDLNLNPPPCIPHLPTPPTPLTFLRNFLSQNKPCKISSSISHFPALNLWPSPSYLPSHLSTSPVSLHLTPTGKADSLSPHPTSPSSLCFASPHVQTLPFIEALHIVRSSSSVLSNDNTDDDEGGKRVVGYLQQQNDCFRSEYGVLSGDVDGDVGWASEAMGVLPEAVNLWIGNEFSETSFHKDHYENLYAVISGEKRFLLVPPTEVHRMYVREYPAATYRYCEDSGEFTLEIDEPVRYVPWCSVDPYPSPDEKEKEMEKFPLYFNGPKPYEVTVKAGEMLYLPSMWFHHVRQSPDDTGLTIAINYWYDMQFDIKYAYFNFLQSIPYPLSSDLTLCNTRKVKSSLNKSLCSSEDESDIRDESDNEEG